MCWPLDFPWNRGALFEKGNFSRSKPKHGVMVITGAQYIGVLITAFPDGVPQASFTQAVDDKDPVHAQPDGPGEVLVEGHHLVLKNFRFRQFAGVGHQLLNVEVQDGFKGSPVHRIGNMGNTPVASGFFFGCFNGYSHGCGSAGRDGEKGRRLAEVELGLLAGEDVFGFETGLKWGNSRLPVAFLSPEQEFHFRMVVEYIERVGGQLPPTVRRQAPGEGSPGLMRGIEGQLIGQGESLVVDEGQLELTVQRLIAIQRNRQENTIVAGDEGPFGSVAGACSISGSRRDAVRGAVGQIIQMDGKGVPVTLRTNNSHILSLQPEDGAPGIGMAEINPVTTLPMHNTKIVDVSINRRMAKVHGKGELGVWCRGRPRHGRRKPMALGGFRRKRYLVGLLPSCMRLALLVLLMICLRQGLAQPFSATPNTTLSAEVIPGLANEAAILFVPQGVDTLHLRWRRMQVDMPAGWKIDLCDYGECYGGIPSFAYMLPAIAPQQPFVKLVVQPGEVPGAAWCWFRVYYVPDESQFLDIHFHLQTPGFTALDSESPGAAGVSLFPNPANQVLHLRADGTLSGCQILGPAGQQRWAGSLTGGSELILPTADWPSGYYLLTSPSGYTRSFLIIH